jgi:hypothetical protein
MFALLKSKMGITKRSATSKSASARRSVRLGLEHLETREVLSGVSGLPVMPVTGYQSPNTPVQTTSPTNPGLQSAGLSQSILNAVTSEIQAIENFLHLYQVLLYDFTHQVPSFTSVDFKMTSQRNGGTNYTLLIQQQTNQLFGTANFTGLWGGHAQVTGTLSVVPDGSISIQASWTDGTNNHTLQGTITGQPGSYHIEADVVVNGNPNMGPGHLSGNQV